MEDAALSLLILFSQLLLPGWALTPVIALLSLLTVVLPLRSKCLSILTTFFHQMH